MSRIFIEQNEIALSEADLENILEQWASMHFRIWNEPQKKIFSKQHTSLPR